MTGPKSENAEAKAIRILEKFSPADQFVLTHLKPTLKLHKTWVFRCKVKGRNESYILKFSDPARSGHEEISNQFQRLTLAHKEMEKGPNRVPFPHAIFEEDCAMIVEDAKGQTLQQAILDFDHPSQAKNLLLCAGRWIASFQKATTRKCTFNATPHVNWLTKKVDQLQQNSHLIPDHPAFMIAFKNLQTLAKAAQGSPGFRCITHRDFHTRNVIFRKNGTTYGIDFENTKEDVALRDVMSLLSDFIVRWPDPLVPTSAIQGSASAFLEGYADKHTTSDVFHFFQTYYALNEWSNLAKRPSTSLNRLQKISRLRHIATTPFVIP